ncbi:hypothetical protein DPMN_120242 [Dreissena polymorpha]|uniref:Uncharacterized protein n=1 Tax=Dreissena polymorpha TaxID=45954 RepID=A0A9D4GJD9_DREPO|nr:hypothetical protein DPMN_120242 [Dreissena polymorpha]
MNMFARYSTIHSHVRDVAVAEVGRCKLHAACRIVVLFVHLIVHLVTISIDPCDDKVLQKKLPNVKFDRST